MPPKSQIFPQQYFPIYSIQQACGLIKTHFVCSYIYKNQNLKKQEGITIKTKQTSNKLESVIRNISCIGYCYNSLKPNSCTNKAFASNLQDLIPTLAGIKYICKTHQPKQGLNLLTNHMKLYTSTNKYLNYVRKAVNSQEKARIFSVVAMDMRNIRSSS